MTLKKYASALLLTMSLSSSSFAVFQEELVLSDGIFRRSVDADLKCQDGSFSCANQTKMSASKEVATKRLLSFDGGGSRGVFEATLAAVLEEMFNNETNAPLLRARFNIEDNRWIALRDVFDAVAGTSTGSILATGLFGHKIDGAPILDQAVEGLQLYMRHGPEIFDKHKNFGIGLFRPAYSAEGLEGLLQAFFGDAEITQAQNKPIYVVAFNTESSGPEVFTSKLPQTLRQHMLDQAAAKNEGALLRDVVRASAAAPTFFSGKVFPLKNGSGEAVLIDGGLAANNPAKVLYDYESKGKENIELYSFGTGIEPFEKLASKDSGIVLQLPDLIRQLFDGQANAIIESLCADLHAIRPALTYFARLNPKLHNNQAGMNKTSSVYMNNAVSSMFDMVRYSDTFRDMVAQLNLEMPQGDALESIIKTVHAKLYNFKGATFDDLSIYDKEYLWRAVKDLDTDVYAHISLNGQTLEGKALTDFQEALLKYIAAKEEIASQQQGYVCSVISGQPDSVAQMLTKATQFHDYMMSKGVVLENADSDLSAKMETVADEYMNALDTVGIKTHNASYIQEMTQIFIKDLFRNVGSSIVESDVQRMLESVKGIANERRSKKSWILSVTHNTRLDVLSAGLQKYIENTFRIPKDSEEISLVTSVVKTGGDYFNCLQN